MKKTLFVAGAMAAMSLTAQAQVKAPKGGKAISDELIGIFFEDISSAADGGLCAELVRNGSFEFNANEQDGWGPSTAWRVLRPGHSLGMTETLQKSPIHPNNPNYMQLTIERVGHYYDYDGWTGYGLQNDGYDGIAVKAGAKYDFSVFLRNMEGEAKDLRVVLVAPGKETKILAEATIKADSKAWKKYEAVLTASEDCSNASLQMLFLTKGKVDMDYVSLMPEDTYKGHGLRRDLAETLEALNPKFMRFPGGCVVHGGGDGFWNTYRWKTTIGPRETRKELKNCWGYHQSMTLGYQEYFQLCEDIGMEPLPILPVGVSCQGTNGGWGMRTQAQDACPLDEMQEWIDEALDLIEWANGDVTTKWGRVRAENGHPKPFNLKYLGLGNEEKITPEFEERFTIIYNKVREKYPDIVIVGTAGPGSHHGNPDYENGWRIAESLNVPILDEHYYEPRDYFLNNQHNYDSYPRTRQTKVYLGEYAAKDKKLLDALYEGLYLCGVERNADVVTMTSYAPLFAKKNRTNWNPDLIYFDNESVVPTPSYYVQQMFGLSSGQVYYGDVVKTNAEDKYENSSCVLNTKKGELYLKIVNASEQSKKIDVDLSRFAIKDKRASVLTLKGQPMDENNFEATPLKPTKSTLMTNKKMQVEAQPYSIQLITIEVK